MSAAVSTDPRPGRDTVRQAARGILPPWARVSAERRAHIERVVALLDEWAQALRLPEAERERWRAAGWLHDALRDAKPQELSGCVPPEFQHFPPPLLHGPAAAELLGAELDEELCMAIRYHTTGHPELGRLGSALYLADFLEPGRDFEEEWRASLRARMPAQMQGVLREVIAARIKHLIESRKPIRSETAAFWSKVVAVGA
ncbi:MAG: HD domain-containing protein [Longimicrobiaceae bacterium]